MDRLFWDDWELLPGDYMICIEELVNYRNNKPFKVIYDGEEKRVIRSDDFLHYYGFWETCKEFGMPNGSGWYNEAPWVVDFLKSFNRVERENEQFTIQKSKRK